MLRKHEMFKNSENIFRYLYWWSNQVLQCSLHLKNSITDYVDDMY